MAEKTAAPHSRYSMMRMASSKKRPLSSFKCRERQPCSRWPGIIQISAPLARRTATSSTSETAFTPLQVSSGSHSQVPSQCVVGDFYTKLSSSYHTTFSHCSCEVGLSVAEMRLAEKPHLWICQVCRTPLFHKIVAD